MTRDNSPNLADVSIPAGGAHFRINIVMISCPSLSPIDDFRNFGSVLIPNVASHRLTVRPFRERRDPFAELTERLKHLQTRCVWHPHRHALGKLFMRYLSLRELDDGLLDVATQS